MATKTLTLDELLSSRVKNSICKALKVMEDKAGHYAVIGAIALAKHGVIRSTTDIDFLLRPDKKEKVVKGLQAVGFEIEDEPDPSQTIMKDRKTGFGVDLLFASDEPYDSMRQEADIVDLCGGKGRIPEPDLLVLGYLLSPKEQNKIDAINLLKSGKVDVRKILNLVWHSGDRDAFKKLNSWIAESKKKVSHKLGHFSAGK